MESTLSKSSEGRGWWKGRGEVEEEEEGWGRVLLACGKVVYNG